MTEANRKVVDTRLYDFVKRALDVAVATVSLIVFLPIILLAAISVRIFLGSPVLFRQIRPGRGGLAFELLKFRTMNDRRDNGGELLPDADRLSGFGRFLRTTSLDELPQLINIARGDMSLVGPRPLLMSYLQLYTPEQSRRHEVRPGLTGWAQVNGRNNVDWPARLAMDVWYVDNRSLRLDLAIIAKSAQIVLSRKGVSQEGSATMPVFTGTHEPGGKSKG
ncbi:Sugar transferase involved in LPS biosynthesis (colanic, teichoic acid) [Mesorhizobium albiziae]|uniref:Sugar transferase involved in LPS biosynthesis (Colanic, teichoic acid) n=1 Tax=Neomesorhizobium albiziae TaxID=335020 RepID=A0A1I4FBH1_9HYPH|nr:sugar transferase [Mesorhizobium albiziae]SFL14136.1 Sugar transferase involved in LPS biosynthesis (colanic, teichoic acid) [Mesorhizobium albiziae]